MASTQGTRGAFAWPSHRHDAGSTRERGLPFGQRHGRQLREKCSVNAQDTEGVLWSDPTQISVTTEGPGSWELGRRPLAAPTPSGPCPAQRSPRDFAPGGVWRHLETFVVVTDGQAPPVSRTEPRDAAKHPTGHRTASAWGYLSHVGLRGALRTRSARLLQMGLFRAMWSLGGQDRVSPPSRPLRSTPAENSALPLLCPGY